MTRKIPLRLIMMVLISWAAILFPCERCFCQSEPLSGWDSDGGFETDYSGIPRLEWTGPGSPGTYLEYLQGRMSAPFSSMPVYAGPAGGRANKALVLVETVLYTGIQTNLARYVIDLENDGYTVEVHQIAGGTPADLKAFIISNSADLAGCVFVGDLPAAWYESEIWGHEEFPCDLYFMDLDGSWVDSDLDGMFDSHTSGTGDVGPEIFIGHIDTSMMTGNEADLTNEYLDKNHNYWNGAIYTTDYALSYTEDDWASYMDIRTDIQYSYPDFDDIPAPATDRDDYVNNRVPNTDYEFIQLCCHSSSTAHHFTRGGLAYNSEIQAIVPHAMFYNLFCCSTLRFTDSDFLGGAYIYDTSLTSVAVIGSTKTGSMLTFYAFYQPFGAGESFGEAFRQWFNYLAPYNNEEIAWHYGMTIAGDPFLHKTEPALFLRFPDDVPSGHLPPGPETTIIVEVESGSETYQQGSGFMHYRFDPADPFTPVPFAPLGGDFYEVAIPGARPGDAPEFYFVAETDAGAIITSPPDAPADVYSFDVCIADLLLHDDFEGDMNWTVENENVSAGAWERCVPNTTSGEQVAPEEDNPGGTGTHCFVTGNGPQGGTYSDYDVDGGPTRLISPTIDLSSGDARISAYNWYYSRDGDDPYEVEVSNDNGASWTNVYSSYSTLNGWVPIAFNVADYVTPTAQVKVRYSAQDQPNNDIVEAGVDDFKVERLDYDPSLWSGAYDFAAGDGCDIPVYLEAGTGFTARKYKLVAGFSGSHPGTLLPGGLVTLPLNRDWLTNYVLDHPSSAVFRDFHGTLDGEGRATGRLVLQAGQASSQVGKTMTLAFTVIGPCDFASNAITIEIQP